MIHFFYDAKIQIYNRLIFGRCFNFILCHETSSDGHDKSRIGTKRIMWKTFIYDATLSQWVLGKVAL